MLILYFSDMNEEEHPVFGFGIDYGGEIVYCEAVMQDDHYEVLFDGRWIATVAHTDSFDWIQGSGAILPQSIVDEIGLRIESNFQ